MKLHALVALFLLTTSSQVALAAACCGGSASTSSIITNDHETQLQVGYSFSSVVGSAKADGSLQALASTSTESTQVLGLSGATLLSDLWQVSLATSLSKRNITQNSLEEGSVGFGDTRLSVGYEFLPELEYSVWKPRGWTFLELTVPTGQSSFESSNTLTTDVTGRGFYTLSLGSVFQKFWNAWDANTTLKLSHSFSRNNPTTNTSTGALWGGIVSLGGGYTPSFLSELRLGIQNDVTIEETSTVTRVLFSPSLQLAYLIGENLSLAGTYRDETLLARISTNSVLSRTFGLSLQKRWNR